MALPFRTAELAMPDMQQTPMQASTHAVSLDAATLHGPAEDPDIAFGCECADPALQIERWQQEMLAGGEPH
jgi:hypothetical protein